MQTIRQMRELGSLDRSNQTLRYNRTLREVGWHGLSRANQNAAGKFWLTYLAAFCAVVLWWVFR